MAPTYVWIRMSLSREGTVTALAPSETVRYARHLALPEVGPDGQRRLRAASVALVGLGGLGAPAALYLAAAGIGRLGLVDDDRVELSNLQRQVLYGSEDVGRHKTEAAAERLGGMNPEVRLDLHTVRLQAQNAMDVLDGYDVVLDGGDNFATRFVVNDACVLLGTPNVHGSVYRFEGSVAVFGHDGGPCYRCLHPAPPPPDAVPSCADGGVLGVLPGMIGTLQATEAIKLVLAIGSSLSGRLVMFDALSLRFRELRVPRRNDCPVCGESPTIREPRNELEHCDTGLPLGAWVEPVELAERIRGAAPPLLIDVREPFELEIARIEGSQHVALGELRARMPELPRSREIVVYCRTDQRSARARRLLLEAGFERVGVLRGGILAWSEHVDASVPVY
jgi:sulfur-carrier protein adenylyltransferase/sulfurtransferase